ncbi:hypothetical protein PCASD_02210 [Puccinia coronata f. sp. avenae]|uniref:Uncharacterized protein n=1 Tax=Puccinia coronata f. sp. avenae TaxID=200324 RepID=A0A2N5VI41_9BASI|nr:hypothetical protein PCASD_02210 [Puccinia coronata f. sp. avenae]
MNQENNERSVKRKRRVTLKETNKANRGNTDKAKELRQMEQSHEMNLSLASRISTHHQSNRTVLTRFSGNTNEQNKDNGPQQGQLNVRASVSAISKVRSELIMTAMEETTLADS